MLANDAELRALGAASAARGARRAVRRRRRRARGGARASRAPRARRASRACTSGSRTASASSLSLGKLGEPVGAAKCATATARALAASERAPSPRAQRKRRRARMARCARRPQHNLATRRARHARARGRRRRTAARCARGVEVRSRCPRASRRGPRRAEQVDAAAPRASSLALNGAFLTLSTRSINQAGPKADRQLPPDHGERRAAGGVARATRQSLLARTRDPPSCQFAHLVGFGIMPPRIFSTRCSQRRRELCPASPPPSFR